MELKFLDSIGMKKEELDNELYQVVRSWYYKMVYEHYLEVSQELYMQKQKWFRYSLKFILKILMLWS